MSDFDYATAWKELALPRFNRLSQEAREKLGLIGELRSAFKQDHRCAVALVDKRGSDDDAVSDRRLPDLARWFDRMAEGPIDDLCKYARAAFFVSHWCPGESDDALVNLMNKTGASWIFTKLADQAIARHFDIGDNLNTRGTSLAVHEGMVRVCWSSKNDWTWTEVGWAVRRHIEACRKRLASVKKLADFETAAEELRRTIGLADESSRPWLTVVEDYDTSPEAILLRAANADAPKGMRVVDRRTVNHRPHPFMIGPRHIERSRMVLDPSVAPCAMPGCQLNHSEHKADTVLLVEMARADEMLTEADRTWLVACGKRYAEAGMAVDGFAFVKPH